MTYGVSRAKWSYQALGQEFDVTVEVRVQAKDNETDHAARRTRKESSTILESLLERSPESIRNSIK